MVEMAERSLTGVFYACVNKEYNWDSFVEYAIFALSTAQQSSTKAVHFDLLYGRPLSFRVKYSSTTRGKIFNVSAKEPSTLIYRRPGNKLRRSL